MKWKGKKWNLDWCKKNNQEATGNRQQATEVKVNTIQYNTKIRWTKIRWTKHKIDGLKIEGFEWLELE